MIWFSTANLLVVEDVADLWKLVEDLAGDVLVGQGAQVSGAPLVRLQGASR